MNRACPVILRSRKETTEILVYKHPQEGNRLLKGKIRPWENLPVACERELLEESGLKALAKTYIGVWEAEYEDQIWGFYRMDCESKLPESWKYPYKDNADNLFQFFWQDLHASLSDDWHPVFKGAIHYLQNRC